METYIIKNVEALWPKINTTYHFDKKVNKSMPCDALADGAEYSIQFRMDNDTAKNLYQAMSKSYQANKKDSWPNKLARPFIKDDDGMFTHKANIKGAYNNQKTTKPLQVDAQGTRLPDDFLLTTGSTVNVAVTFNPYEGYGRQDVNLRLKAVQVVKYVPLEDNNPFEAVEGFTIDADNPFTEETVPEPKKVVNKPATPSKAADDDLSAIVDDWDD